MIPEIGVITVIGLALTIILYFTKWWADRNNEKRIEKDVIDKEIDKANGANSLLRLLDRLRRK